MGWILTIRYWPDQYLVTPNQYLVTPNSCKVAFGCDNTPNVPVQKFEKMFTLNDISALYILILIILNSVKTNDSLSIYVLRKTIKIIEIK